MKYIISAIFFIFILLTACSIFQSNKDKSLDIKNNCIESENQRYQLMSLEFDSNKVTSTLEDFYKIDCPQSLTDIYSVLPFCGRSPGKISNNEIEKAINRLNFIRKLHGLDSLIHNPLFDDMAKYASIIVAANNKLTHNPTSDMKYFTDVGEIGCKISNLALSIYCFRDSSASSLINDCICVIPATETIIDGLLIDFENVSEDYDALGHRRAILNPFLKETSFGRVDWYHPDKKMADKGFCILGAAHIVNDLENSDVRKLKKSNYTLPLYIAYPYHDYPTELFHPNFYMSLSILIDTNDYHNNSKVDFSKVNISIEDSLGHRLKVYDVGYNNDTYGLPNFLRWKVEGLDYNNIYYVSISGVKNLHNNKILKEFNYWYNVRYFYKDELHIKPINTDKGRSVY